MIRCSCRMMDGIAGNRPPALTSGVTPPTDWAHISIPSFVVSFFFRRPPPTGARFYCRGRCAVWRRPKTKMTQTPNDFSLIVTQKRAK